ncbi:glycosyltransferase [Empedobacter falsenii]
MILIDAIFINNGGGKVLLDYLVETLEQTDLKIFYLFDDRIVNRYEIKKENVFIYQNSSLRLRYKFYKKYSSQFSKIFVLGNIPPPIKVKKAEVYTYFHNPMYLRVPNDFSITEKIKYILKVCIINKNKSNTNYWLLQSNTLKEQFIEKFGEKEKVKTLPFYPSLESSNCNVKRIKNTFFYVSNAQANKNHIKLIEAFCNSYDITKKGKLILTVSDKFPIVLKSIDKGKENGYPIENIGFVDRETLTKKYLESEYVIFPSLAESFGLGLIEGVELGCKVISADLPYTYAVCNPSLVFNPFEVESISRAINTASQNDLNNSSLNVQNQIEDLITLLNGSKKN